MHEVTLPRDILYTLVLVLRFAHALINNGWSLWVWARECGLSLLSVLKSWQPCNLIGHTEILMCDNVSQQKPCVCPDCIFPSLSLPTFLVCMFNLEKYGLVDETTTQKTVMHGLRLNLGPSEPKG